MAGQDTVADGWHKSSASQASDCVEVRIAGGQVDIRDTKNRSGAHLTYTYTEWRAFLDGVRLGEFDIPPASPSTS